MAVSINHDVISSFAAEDSGGGWQGQRWWTKAVDDNGIQDSAADYNGEGQERAAKNNGIRHQTEKTMLFFGRGGHTIFVVSTICCFWQGSYNFCVWEVLLTKEKVVHTTPCTTYVEKND